LNTAAGVFQIEKADFAHAAAKNNPAGGSNLGRRRGIGGQGADGTNGLVSVESCAPGINAECFNGMQFLGTADFESILRSGHVVATFVQEDDTTEDTSW
jgi:hypothetical protein